MVASSSSPSRSPSRSSSRPSNRRPGASSAHFDLNWRRVAPGPSGSAAGVPDSGTSLAKPAAAPKLLRAPVLAMAVGKRLLPRAVDRNRVKRIAREAWRHRVAGDPSLAGELHVFIRLARRPAVLEPVCDLRKKRLLRAELDSLLAMLPRTNGPRS
jgi:ribonuclease P protein component